MKQLSVILLIAALLSSVGCFGRGRSATPTKKTVYIQPTTPEGKQCAMQCKQLKVQQYQLAEQEYATKRQDAYDSCSGYIGRKAILSCRRNASNSGLDDVSRDLDKMKADREYKECFRECGGTTEYK